MTFNLQLRQSSFPDLCPVTAAVEKLASAGGVEERGAIYTRREVVDFILELANVTEKKVTREELLKDDDAEKSAA